MFHIVIKDVLGYMEQGISDYASFLLFLVWCF